MTIVQLKVVMAGLDPAIQVRETGAGDAGNPVDARVMPAHDDPWLVLVKTQQPISIPRTALRLRGNDEMSNVPLILTIPSQALRSASPERLEGAHGPVRWE